MKRVCTNIGGVLDQANEFPGTRVNFSNIAKKQILVHLRE